MRFFAGSVQRERSSHFDILRGDVAQALDDPGVISRLGALADKLRAANEKAFLPNVRHGEVAIPPSYLKTDGIAILPVLDITGDRVLLPDASVFQPTPATKKLALDQLMALDPPTGRRAMQRIIDAAIGKTISQWSAERQQGTDGFASPNPQTHWSNLRMEPFTILGRPLIVLPPDMPGPHSVVNACSGIHELTHGHDALQTPILPPENDPYITARNELRGYTAGGAVVYAALEAGQIDDEFAQKNLGLVLSVDELREDYGLTAKQVLAPDFAFTKELDDLASEMCVSGAIEI